MGIKMDDLEDLEELKEYERGYVIIDLDHIYDNMVNMKKNIPRETALMAVVKTDGYGCGAVPVARTVDALVEGYGVATVQEGISLRVHGITKPVFILGYTPKNACEQVIAHKLIPSVFQYEMAEVLSKAAVGSQVMLPVNIAVDTGMGRIGFLPDEEGISEIVRISQLPGIELKSIFTHFAKADEKDKTSAQNQYKIFQGFINKLKERNIIIPIHQCGNSAAILEMPQTSMNLMRAGISMYGYYPSEEIDTEVVKLYPAVGLKSHIVHLKEVEAGTPISYGSTYITKRKERIATIPLGYGDGYPRNLSNKGYVLVHGKRAPICGRVCMDQFMIDVTDIEESSLWDEVTLVGEDGMESITVEELAELAGTFHYEFLCDLGKRLPRVYKRHGRIVGKKDYFQDQYEDFC